MDVEIEIDRASADEVISLLAELDVRIKDQATVRNFGVDGELVRLVAEIATPLSATVGAALWTWARVRSAQSVKIGDAEIRGMSARSVIEILRRHQEHDS